MDAGSADVFDEFGTLGIEEEFYVVDDAGRPTSGTDELVYETEPPTILEGRLDHELFKFVIETQTPTIEDPADAPAVHREVRDALVDHAEAHGYRIAAAGLHPLAKWREQAHAEKPRYASQLDRIQYPQHRNTTAGLHVHVGVDDAEKAVWIANELRPHLPILLALSANSPYWCGFDTGLASARAKVFEALPNTGMPMRFADFESYRSFERLMIETGSIADRGELWFDVRPHTGLGTVEVRTPDAQADPTVAMAFVEYVHALVVDYAERYEDGESGRRIRRELLDENKWRAMRHGRDASFVLAGEDLLGTGAAAGDVIELGEAVERECDRLDVAGLRDVYEREDGATAQRRLRERDGDDALCRSLLL